MIGWRAISVVGLFSIIYCSWADHPPLSNHIDVPEGTEIELEDHNLDHVLNPKTSLIPIGNPYDLESDIPGAPLNPTDFTNSQAMDESYAIIEEDQGSVQDPIEFAGLFEGDIIINSPADMPVFDSAGAKRNAIKDDYKKWSQGVIPYVISSSYSNNERGVIAQAFREFHQSTCIRFVPRTVEKDYIHILKKSGCSSSVGRVGHGQAVSLGIGCVHRGVVMHELMHAAGFWHEQSRSDRDGFITINWHNIQKGMDYNFEKFSWNTIQSLGVRYDPGSIMHYGAYAFAKDRSLPTIIPKDKRLEIGQRKGFSQTDIQKLKKLYNCAGVEPTVTTTTTTQRPGVIATPAPVSQCADSHQYCKSWSDLGECNKNPEWMNINCKKSCNKCGASCQDQSKHCGYWAKAGECTKNAEYMSLFCKKSCGACHENGAIVDKCEDNNQHCVEWGKMGQCRVNPNYMLKRCKKSCRQC